MNKTINEGYTPPFALLVLDGDDNKWKVYKALDSDEFDKESFLADANLQVFPNVTYARNYIDAKVVPNKELDSYLQEDVEVGTKSHTQVISLALVMEKEHKEGSFDYTVDIDEVGQIVFTPSDTSASFIDIRKLNPGESVSESASDNQKTFSVELTANMIAEDNNFDYFVDVDEVGQAIVTPEVETTSFLTVSVNNSLNLVTESTKGISLDT